MRDGDYHDIWAAAAFAIPVLLLGKLLVEGNQIGQWIVFAVAFTGGALIMQRIGDRERRKQQEED